MGNFQELKVWQRAKDLAVYIYKMTDSRVFSKNYGLCDQMQRAGVSIVSNIAEVDDLGTDKQSIKHFYIAKGSCAEVLTQAIIAYEVQYADETDFEYTQEYTQNECQGILGMLTKLIQVRSGSSK